MNLFIIFKSKNMQAIEEYYTSLFRDPLIQDNRKLRSYVILKGKSNYFPYFYSLYTGEPVIILELYDGKLLAEGYQEDKSIFIKELGQDLKSEGKDYSDHLLRLDQVDKEALAAWIELEKGKYRDADPKRKEEIVSLAALTLLFPYKRRDIDPDVLWKNGLEEILTVAKKVAVEKTWQRPARNMSYFWSGFPTGTTLGFVSSEESYKKLSILTDYFTERVRITAFKNVGEKISPLNYFIRNYQTLYDEACRIYELESEKSFNYYFREAIFQKTSKMECSTFKISSCKAILEYFKSKKVLDPSAGWGDRILGAALVGVDEYLGVDPNLALSSAYQEILSFIKKKGVKGRFEIISEDFLKVDLTGRSFDTVFTSPPFFSYEIYSSAPTQSIHGRETVKVWLEEFLYPYIRKAVEHLMIGGQLCLYISDTGSQTFVSSMHYFIIDSLKLKPLGIAAIIKEKTTWAYPLWCYTKVK